MMTNLKLKNFQSFAGLGSPQNFVSSNEVLHQRNTMGKDKGSEVNTSNESEDDIKWKILPIRKLTVGETKVNKIFRRKESEGIPIGPVLHLVTRQGSSISSQSSPLRQSNTLKSIPPTLPFQIEEIITPKQDRKAEDDSISVESPVLQTIPGPSIIGETEDGQQFQLPLRKDFFKQRTQQLSDVDQERQEDRSELTHEARRISSFAITPLHSFIGSSPASRNSSQRPRSINKRLRLDLRHARRSSDNEQEKFNPLNLDIAPMILPSGRTRRTPQSAERQMSESIMEAPLFQEDSNTLEKYSSFRQKTDYGEDLFLSQSLSSRRGFGLLSPVNVLNSNTFDTHSVIQTQQDEMLELLNQKQNQQEGRILNQKQREIVLFKDDDERKNSEESSSISHQYFDSQRKDEDSKLEEGDFAKAANRASSRKILTGRNSIVSGKQTDTRRISEVYLSVGNSMASRSNLSSPDRSTKNLESVIQEQPCLRTETDQDVLFKPSNISSQLTSSKRLSYPTISLKRVASFAPSYESLKKLGNKSKRGSLGAPTIKRSLSMKPKSSEPLLQEEKPSEEKESSSFLSHSSAIMEESMSEDEHRKVQEELNFLRRPASKTPSLFRRSITINFSSKLQSDERIRKIIGRGKMEAMQRMKQSFMECNPPDERPGAGNITTLAENNDTVKRDIIKKVIENQKKASAKVSPAKSMKLDPKKEEGYSKLKVAIKEDVLKMSCADEVLKSPLLSAREEAKKRQKKEGIQKWKPPHPFEMKLKFKRVPYDQLPLQLEPNWFLGEPDFKENRKHEYIRSQTSIYRKSKSLFTSMISVRSGGEGEDIGDKIGLSTSGNLKLTMGKKLPDQHIISYETMRNLVHSRFDTARASPRRSIIAKELFGQGTVTRLRRLQIEELDKINEEEKKIQLKRTFSKATDLGEELKDHVEEHLTPVTTEDKGILAGLLQPGMGGLRFIGKRHEPQPDSDQEVQKGPGRRGRLQSQDINQMLLFNLHTQEEQHSLKLPELGTHLSDQAIMQRPGDKTPKKEREEEYSKSKQSRSVSPTQRRISRRASKRDIWSVNSSMNKSIFMKSMQGGKSQRKMLRVLEEMQIKEQKKRQEEENRKKEEASIQKSKLEIDLEQEMEKDSERERNRKIREEAKAFQDQKLKENMKNLRKREETPDRRLSTILDPKLGRRSDQRIRDQAENEIEMGLEHQNRLLKRAKNETILMRKGTSGSGKSNYSTAGDEIMRKKDISTFVRRPTLLSPVFGQGNGGNYVRQRSDLPSDVKNYRRGYKAMTEQEKLHHEEQLKRQEEILESEKEWKQVDMEDLEEELGRVRREPKRGAQWSGDEVIHDFAGMAHNHPLLPQPLPLQVYLFNKYEKSRRSTYSTGSGIIGTETLGTQEHLLGNQQIYFNPTTLICPYMEDEPIPKVLLQRNSGMAMLSRQSSIRLTTTSRFAPLITERLERMSQHLPATYAMTLSQQASEGLYGVTQQDRIEMRQNFMNVALSRLNHIKVWKKGCWASVLKFRYSLKKAVKSLLFENFMTLCVAINTIGLAAQHYGQSEATSNTLEVLNLLFTGIFIFEMVIKLASLGIKRYLSDPLHYLDGAVVIISIMELTLFPSSYDAGAVSAFKTFRIFRTFRVLRVARLLRSLKQMQMIVSVISRSVGSFMYLAMLLLLFLFIYTLLGMQLFGGKFDFQEGTPRGNFDTFHSAFVTVFQLLTLENWQFVLFSGMRSFGGWSVIYFLSWIFIGNFVLLNLFLAILLDSFLDQEDSTSFDDQKDQVGQIDSLQSGSLESRSQSSQAPNEGFFIAQPTSLSPPMSPSSSRPISPQNPKQTPNSKFQSQTTTPYKSPNQSQQTGSGAPRRLPMRRNSMIKRPGQLGDRLSVSTFALQRQNHIAGAHSQTEPLDKRKSKSAAIAGFIKKRGSKRPSTRNLKKAAKQKEEDSLDDLDDQTVPLKSKRNRAVKLKDIECDRAFFIFRRDSCLRRFCYRLYNHRFFERIILTLIVLSSVKLAADTYFLETPASHPIIRISRYLDSFFTITFTLELLIKAITLGFAADRGSYLREGWNIVDFIIVIAGLLDMALPWVNIESVRVLRLIRTIRPLRFISHNPDLQIVVQALLHSMSAIVNVAIVVFFVWLMFAIFGVSVLGGKFQHCSHYKYDFTSQLECQAAGYQWMTYSSNFDNVINAMQTLFIVSSLQGWPEIMYNAVDSTDVARGPSHNATPAIAYYFVVFIFIGSFFFVNLFVGVMFLNYKEAKKFDPLFKSTMNDREARWIDIMRLIEEAHPDLEPLQRPTQGCRLRLYNFVNHEIFDFVIIICIVLNMIGLTLHFEGAPEYLIEILFIANLIFTAIFTLQATLKILGMGKLYFRSKWNIFDFIVVVSSLIEIIVHYLAIGSITILRVAPQVIRIFRVLRVTRIIRLINKSKGLQALIFTILFAIRSLFNIFMLLVLIFFIYSVLGVFLFGEVKEGVIISRYTNFRDFGNAMITLLRISTGQEWNRIMEDCQLTGKQCIPNRTCGSQLAPIYFFSFVIVCSYVMLNLFILVIIQQFDDYYLPKENVLQNFKKQLDLFKQQWLQYTKRYNGRRMKQEDLYKFFKQMQEPLGMQQTKPKDIIRNIIKMDIESDPSGLVYFNVLLFKAMRRVYGTQGELKPSKLILNYERNTYYRIKRQYYSEMMAFMKNQKDQPQYILTGDKPNLANPMMTRLYLRTSFEKWRKMHHNHRLLETGPQQFTTFRIKRKTTKEMYGSSQNVIKAKLAQIQDIE